AFEEVADALDLTPAYCRSVASFYDMFHLEAVGRHVIEVCTNVSCALVGAQQVVEAFERELGIHPGETSDDGRFTLRLIECAGGRGRGGAGFPMGRKASFLAKGTGRPTYLTVNADESEPGTFKDREIMFRVPHRLIEGCLITAHAIESQNVFIYIRGEYLHEFEIIRGALDEVREAGLLGGVTIVLHRGAGAYICGEETALLESLGGKRGQPRSKPPFPAVQGLYASPTLINNVETIATVPKIVELGGEEYAKLGVNNSAGTRV